MAEYYPDIPGLFAIGNDKEFAERSIEVFRFQFSMNEVYQKFCSLLGTTIENVRNINQIPFLPVEVFKTQQVQCGNFKAQRVFTSSGTTGQSTSKHIVKDLTVYDQSLANGFEMQYGPIADYCFLALLPSYLEREDSSLVYMVQKLMELSAHSDNGFYLYDHDKLAGIISKLISRQQKTILIGVSFALLDFSEKYPMPLPENFIVMETGGMKGRRREMVREELQEILCKRFQVQDIHSEYGMTELLSQAWSTGRGLFHAPPWMKILIRDMNDPFRYLPPGKTGAINIIDLANIHSCAFIATQDLGRINNEGTFEVLGRFDNSDMRGCNLMVS